MILRALCPVCGARMQKTDPLPEKPGTEEWLCTSMLEERFRGGKGPFKHDPWSYVPMYIIRSLENARALAAEQAQLVSEVAAAQKEGKPYHVPPLSTWMRPRNGDTLVDHGLRTVYFIAMNGVYTKCKDPEQAAEIIQSIRDKQKEIARGFEDAARNKPVV